MNVTCKRLLSWLVVVTMVLSMVPVLDLSNFAVTTKALETDPNALSKLPADAQTAIAAAQTEITRAQTAITALKAMDSTFKAATGAFEDYCPVCSPATKVTWNPLNPGAATANLTGHYFLTGQISTQITGVSGQPLCLNLNGNNIDTTAAQTYAIYSAASRTINIMDSAATEGTVKGYSSNTSTGATIYAQGARATVNIYGGNITKDSTALKVPVVFCGSIGGFINMYDGVISATGMENTTNASTVKLVGNSNGNEANSARFRMYGGEINCGKVNINGANGNIHVSTAYATFELYGGTISGGEAKSHLGGNFCLTAGVLKVYGGTIKDGKYTGTNANMGGGNIGIVTGGKLYMYGGVISGGGAKSGNGGNITFRKDNGYGAVEIYGGKIIDGTTGGEGANIFAAGQSTNGITLKIAGGQISSGIAYGANTTFTLSGAPVIKISGIEGQTIDADVAFAVTNGGNLDVSGITGGEIQIEGNLGDVFSAPYEKAAEIAQYFVPTDPALMVVANDNNQLEIVEYQEPAVKAWCSACKEEKEWTELTGALHNEGGHYILKGDVDIAGYGIVLEDGAEGLTLCLDLKGHTLTANNVAIQVTTANTVNVMDTDGGGEVVGKQKGNVGAALTVNHADAEINLYGGTFKRGAAAATNEYSRAVNMGTNGGTINAYEGVIIDGRFDGSTNGGTYPTAVYVQGGEFNLEGGEIIGGTASSDAGSVRVDTNATFNLRSGTVRDGQGRSGGNFALPGGTLNMYGGEIKDGKAASTTAVLGGGNIYITTGGKLHMEGGTVTGGTITGGKGVGGNIAIRDDAANYYGTVEILGGKIIDGTAKTKGDNIYLVGKADAKTKLTIGGTAQISGGIVTGANVDITLSGTPKILTSDIEGQTVTANSGLNVTASSNISVTDLKEGADIQVSGAQNTVFSKTGEDASAVVKYFTSTADKTKVKVNDAKQLVIMYHAPEEGKFEPWEHEGYAYCPVCDNALVEWTPIDNNTAAGHVVSPQSTPAVHNHVYLAEDISKDVAATGFFLATGNHNTICLNLNGKTLEVTNGRAFQRDFCFAYWNVMDTEGGAVVTGDGIFHLDARENRTVNVYGGTFKTNSGDSIVYIGGNGGTFNLHSGTLDATGAAGGVFGLQGKVGDQATANFNVYGGEIIGNGEIVGRVGSVLQANATTSFMGCATFTMTDGTISGGYVQVRNDNTATISGGNIEYLTTNDGAYAEGGADVNLEGAYDGKTTVTLTGAPQIAQMAIGENVVVNIDGLTEGAMIYIHGAVDSETDAVETVLFTSKNAEAVKGYILPYYDEYYVNVADGNFSLQKNGAAIVTEDGRVFYKTFDDALVDYDISNKAYLEVHKYNQTMNLTGDAYIDNRGITVAVTGTGNCTLYIMDSANDDYDGYNHWTVNGDVSVAPEAINPINGRRYISIKETDAQGNIRYNAHRIQMYLTGISLRPTAAGLYYKAAYKCDDKLANRVKEYGIVYNAFSAITAFDAENNVPSIATDFATKYTDGVATGTSVLVTGIFKETNEIADNVRNGETEIRATPYINVDIDGDGVAEQYVLANVEANDHNAAYLKNNGTIHAAMSMYKVLETMNNAWNNTEGLVLTDAQKTSLKTFYNTWKDLGMSEWKEELPNISAEA